MTLDEFKTMLKTQQRKTACMLDLAKCDCHKVVTGEHPLTNFANAKRKAELLDVQLDMLDAIVCWADKIETPQTKMREFL